MVPLIFVRPPAFTLGDTVRLLARLTIACVMLVAAAPAWAGDMKVSTSQKPARPKSSRPSSGPTSAASTATARGAVLSRIQEQLAGRHRDAALEVYEAFVAQTGREDLGLLVLIVHDHLEALTTGTGVEVQVGALKALAGASDARAKAALVQLAAAGVRDVSGLEATLALNSLHDNAAIREIRGLAASGPKGLRPRAIAALGDVDRSAAAALAVEGLQDPDPLARMAYTDLVARFGARSAIPLLKHMLADRNAPFLRLPAAAALRHFGDPSGDEILRQGLSSPLPDARLIAARALAEGGDRSWVSAVSPILGDPDGLNRLNAAELLLPIDRGTALRSLKTAAADVNPVVRAEAARVVALASPPEIPALRALLSDTSDLVRLQAAAAILNTAKAAVRSSKAPGI
jgi:HEAT repeat protein